MKHNLKTKEEYFKALWCCDKTFEIRKDDRKFEERDEIRLEEIDNYGEYTGRAIDGRITYLTTFEQKNNYVVFSFKEISRTEE